LSEAKAAAPRVKAAALLLEQADGRFRQTGICSMIEKYKLG